MRSPQPRLLFSKEELPFILEVFGKKINEDGMIVEAGTNEPVYTPEGDTILANKFGGIKKGSEIFLRNDLLSIINLTEGKY